MRKFSKLQGRGPRLGTCKKKNVKSLGAMENKEFDNLKVRSREVMKVIKELDKRNVQYNIVRERRSATIQME